MHSSHARAALSACAQDQQGRQGAAVAMAVAAAQAAAGHLQARCCHGTHDCRRQCQEHISSRHAARKPQRCTHHSLQVSQHTMGRSGFRGWPHWQKLQPAAAEGLVSVEVCMMRVHADVHTLTRSHTRHAMSGL